MPGPEDLQVSYLDPGHGLHVTCMHSVTGFEVRDLIVGLLGRDFFFGPSSHVTSPSFNE